MIVRINSFILTEINVENTIIQGCWANPDDGNCQKTVRITPTRPNYPNRT